MRTRRCRGRRNLIRSTADATPVYPGLRQGSYCIHPGTDHAGAHFEIIGGEVTQLDLRL